MNWPAYADYKEMAGSYPVPNHWKVSKLRHLLKVNPSVPESLRSDMNEMVTFLPMEAVGEDGILDTTRERPVRELLTGYSYFANGDVIMAKVTPCFENGKAAVIETLPTTDGFGTSEVTTLRPSSDLDQRFLGYFVRSDRFRQSSIAAMTGAGGLKRVPDEHVRSFEIGLPSGAEQCGIVMFLDRETTKIDTLIAKQEQLIATLLEDRAATITQAVTNGLDPDVEMKDSGSTGLGYIPSDWTISRLKMLLVEPLTYGANAAADDATVGHPRYVRITDIDQNGSLRKDTFRSLPPEVAAPYLLKEGDLLFARSGATVGKTFMYEDSWGICCYAGYLIRARFDQTKVIPSYMNYFAATAPYWYHIASAQIQATIQNVSAERYGELVVPVPPLHVQRAIVENLNISCAKIDALTSKSTKVIEILRECRSALITDAVTGKIDVRGVA